MAGEDAKTTAALGASSTFVPFPTEADFVKVDIYDAAGAVVAWVQLDSSVASATPGADNCERIKPNGSALIPWGYRISTSTGLKEPGRYMITESGTTSVNVVVAKGRV